MSRAETGWTLRLLVTHPWETEDSSPLTRRLSKLRWAARDMFSITRPPVPFSLQCSPTSQCKHAHPTFPATGPTSSHHQ